MEQDRPTFPQGDNEPINPEPAQPTNIPPYTPVPPQPVESSYSYTHTAETTQPVPADNTPSDNLWQTPQQPIESQSVAPANPQPTPVNFAEPTPYTTAEVASPEPTPVVNSTPIPAGPRPVRNWKLITATTVAGVLLVAGGVLAGLLIESQKDLTQTKDRLAELESSNEDLAENSEEAKTEAEKAKEEAEKAQKNASSASKKAASAEQEANSAKADANNVRTELAVAQACARLFDTVAGDISSYDSNMQLALAWVVKSLVSTADGYTDAAFSELETADAYYSKASAIYPRIDSTLTKVASGDC